MKKMTVVETTKEELNDFLWGLVQTGDILEPSEVRNITHNLKVWSNDLKNFAETVRNLDAATQKWNTTYEDEIEWTWGGTSWEAVFSPKGSSTRFLPEKSIDELENILYKYDLTISRVSRKEGVHVELL